MTIHLVLTDYDVEQPMNVVVAECSAVALIMPDCSVQPPDFDFVGPDKWDERDITCPECIRSLKTAMANKREALEPVS